MTEVDRGLGHGEHGDLHPCRKRTGSWERKVGAVLTLKSPRHLCRKAASLRAEVSADSQAQMAKALKCSRCLEEACAFACQEAYGMAGMPMPMPMMGAFPPMVFDQSMLPGALLLM